MSRLEWFDGGHGLIGVELGIVRPDIYMKFIRFKVYCDFRHDGNDKTTAITLTAERNKCSERTIYNSIYFFEGFVSK